MIRRTWLPFFLLLLLISPPLTLAVSPYGDFDESGYVDQDDFDLLKQGFGSSYFLYDHNNLVKYFHQQVPLASISPGNGPYQAGKQIAYHSDSTGYDYLLYVPRTYTSPPTGGWPLIIYFHGAGTGQLGESAEYVRQEAFPQQLDMSNGSFQAVVVSPKLNRDHVDNTTGWLHPSAAANLKILIDEIQAGYRVNQSRTSVTGYSMGGAATYKLALTYPSEFYRAVPVAGYIESITRLVIPENICNLAKLKLRAYHAGMTDGTIHGTINPGIIQAVNQCGGPFAAEEMYQEGANHSTVGAVFLGLDSPLYTFLLGD